MPQLHTWDPLSMCHQNSVRFRLKILSIRKEPMLSGFLTLNAQASCLTLEINEFRCCMAYFLMERIFRSTPNRVVTAHAEKASFIYSSCPLHGPVR